MLRTNLMNHLINRLQVFSDAVLAIAATILATPLAKIEETTRLDMYLRGLPLLDVLVSDYQLESFAMFFGSFTIVFMVWIRHGRQFTLLSSEQVGGETSALVVANMAELFLATLLPYTTASASRARLSTGNEAERRSLALPFCANIFALATTRVVFESFALRARPSVGAVLFNLIESFVEMAGAMVILALGSSVLAGEEVFLPFLAIPIVTLIVRSFLVRLYGEPDKTKPDWHRLEGFVDGCVAVVGTMMVLEIKPPVDCDDMKLETCILHFKSGCRATFDMDHPRSKRFQCRLERAQDQMSDMYMVIMYFGCFSLMVSLWYLHHVTIWYGYAPPRSLQFVRMESLGTARSLLLTGVFCAWLGLYPFAFALVGEFSLKPYSVEDDPRWFPDIEEPLDPQAGTTACAFFLLILMGSSIPLALLFLCAPRRMAIPWSACILLLTLPVISLVNLLLLYMASEQVRLYPLLLVIVVGGLSSTLARFLPAPAWLPGDDLDPSSQQYRLLATESAPSSPIMANADHADESNPLSTGGRATVDANYPS